jgi:putative ABC transport system substrate-binding protein
MTDKLNFQPKLGTWLTVLLSSVLLGLLISGCGAEEPQVQRVGILTGLEFAAATADGFKAGMAELGYVEGENVVYDVQSTDFDMAAYQRIVEKFVADEVDLIFAFPTEAALAAKAATQGTDIPVVFAIANIEGTGLVDSVREPGGNITGVRYPGVEVSLKRFEIMRELAPEATRMWLPYQRGYGNVVYQLEALYPAAEAAGVTLIEAPADNGAELEADLQGRAQADDVGFDAILFLVEPLAVAPDAVAVITEVAAEHKIPIGGVLVKMGGEGAVFEVNVDLYDDGQQAARLADKVLRGTPAGTIPVVSAENVLKINYAAAQELGLNVDDGLLSQAAEIIR